MKRFLPSVVWFISGAVVGEVTDTVLFQLWFRLGLLKPVADWFVSLGHTTLANYWGMVWGHLTSWLVIAVVGILGGIFIKRRLVLDLVLFGIGFAFVPLALSACLYSYVPSFGSCVQHVVLIALAVVCGLLTQRFIQNGHPHEHAV